MGRIIVNPDLSAVIDTNDGIVIASSKSTNQQSKSKGRTIDPLFHLIRGVNVVSVHYLRTVLLQEVRDVGIDEDTATVTIWMTRDTLNMRSCAPRVLITRFQ